MASHALHREIDRPQRQTRLVRLGWTHFWLLGCILAGMLGLIVMVFVISLVSR